MAAWLLFDGFQRLESGQEAHVRIWAPLASLYERGGIWPVVVKWGVVLGISGVSIGFLWQGVSKLRGHYPEVDLMDE